MKEKMNLLIAWISASLIFGILSFFAFTYEQGRYSSVILLSAAFGTSIGWFLGILATPLDRGEKTKLSEIGKIFYGFLTGYIISKIDVLISAFSSNGTFQQGGQFGVYTIVFNTALFNTLVVTYVNRSYWLCKKRSDV